MANRSRPRVRRATAIRVDVYPDGGSRPHLMGKLLPEALSPAMAHWLQQLPKSASRKVLADAGLGGTPLRELREEQLQSLAW